MYNCIKLILFLCCFPAMFSSWSCNLINPEETIPTYVRIDSFHFTPIPNTGTISQNITSAWVYFNNQTVGTFDLPAVIPIIAKEPGTLTVMPGVDYSGLQSVQVIYPYFTFDTFSFNPQPGQELHFIPNTHYIADTQLNILQEDFEFGNSFVIYTGDTLRAVTDPSKVFEGNRSGEVRLDTLDYAEHILNVAFTVAGTEAFVEMNYNASANIRMEVGLQTINQTGQLFINYLFGLKPKEGWQKVYIGLQEFLAVYTNKQYRLVIKTIADDPAGGTLLLDNIKIISKK